jgi:hypothetical protein
MILPLLQETIKLKVVYVFRKVELGIDEGGKGKPGVLDSCSQ